MNTMIQWLHLLSAIVAVGGTVFLRFVLLPSLSLTEESERKALMGRVIARFRPILWSSILLLLMTGLYNAVGVFTAPSSPYLTTLVVKILLVLVIFGLALMLTIPWKMFQNLQAHRGVWLLLTVLLSIVVVLLSAYLRTMVV